MKQGNNFLKVLFLYNINKLKLTDTLKQTTTKYPQQFFFFLIKTQKKDNEIKLTVKTIIQLKKKSK